MSSRYIKSLLSLAAVAALALPAVTQARDGSDDPASHVRREDHGLVHHTRHRADHDADRGGRGSDDGPNHR